jgi:O-glycosyl hydrolase
VIGVLAFDRDSFVKTATAIILTAAFSLTSSLFAAEPTALGKLPAGPASVTISVKSQPRQTFSGFGTSCFGDGDYVRLAPERRAELNDLVWREARFNTARIWLRLKRYAPVSGERRFKEAFPDSVAAQVRDAQAAGARHLVLGPCAIPDYLIERLPVKGDDGNGQRIEPYLKSDRFDEHAAMIADFVRDLRDQNGIAIEATGIQNEPNDPDDCVFTPEDVARSVKLLRAALNSRGLDDVKVIAPESVGCNAPAFAQLTALRDDPAAWNALGGLASHSYDGGADGRWAETALASGKNYWMTEFCLGGPEDPGDFFRASAEAAAFLSDVNHGVSCWIHFIGYLSDDPNDNGTRLIAYYNGVPAGKPWLKLFEPYNYLKELGRTFDAGAVFRKSVSSLEEEMTWTRGSKPRLIVASARNPDGAWGIGISDYTSNDFPAKFWYPGQPAQSFTATVVIEELSTAGETPFALRRLGPQLQEPQQENTMMHSGRLTVAINPLELVTLRSR